jgi:ABC-type phosphate transport system substrate-binding protein
MTRHVAIAAALSIALSVLTVTVLAEQAGPRAYVLIVHPANPFALVRRTFVADAYLKRISRWSNGKVLHPADQQHGSPIREAFSNSIVGRSAAAVRAYWQQRIFSGLDVPPPQFHTDAEVVSYVLGHEGAIGYVSAQADLRGAKLLQVDD